MCEGRIREGLQYLLVHTTMEHIVVSTYVFIYNIYMLVSSTKMAAPAEVSKNRSNFLI